MPVTRSALAQWIGLSALSFAQWLCAPASNASQCQGGEQLDRPKIGLVLGGGGARGGAHVGVLKYLEQSHIPVDVIAGTSMGAIIGGLYASGMTAAEIEAVLSDTPWSDLFNDGKPRSQRTLRRKTDDELNLHGPKFGLGKDSALLPSGAVAGQKIGLLFERLITERTRIDNFDQLPIPYRAVAADLVTGDPVLLDSGQLSLAMRSSMSVPGAFDPIRSGDQLLVDGGIVNNVPVDIAREMGADIVIAVDVSTPEMSADKLNNLLSVVNQLSTLMVSSNTEQSVASLGEGDILLKPALGDEFSSADFEKISGTIPLGYEAATAHAETLRALAISTSSYASWRGRLESCTSPPPELMFVRLENRSRFSNEVIEQKISIQPGDPLDYDRLERDIASIYGLGFIRQAQYRVVEEAGATGLVIEVDQDQRGTDFIESGLGLSGDGHGTSLDLRAAYLKTDLNDKGGEFRAAIQLGSEFGLSLDSYLPLDKRLRWSINPGIFASKRSLLYYDDDGHPLIELDVAEYGGELSIGREFGHHLGLFAGVNRYAGEVSINIGDPSLQSYRFDGGEFVLRGIFDRLDDRYMPSQGGYMHLEYVRSMDELGADAEFEQIKFSMFAAQSWNQHTLWLGSRFNTTLDDQVPAYALFTGGGFLNMSGFDKDELIGQHFGLSMLGYRYRWGQGGLLPAYVGTTLEYGNAGERASDVYREGVLNGSVYLGYDSPLGPLYLGYGWSEASSGLLFLRLGAILGAESIGRR